MPTVVTIHDLIHLQFPHYFKAHVQPYYHIAVRALLAQARRVITDDDRTVDELQRRLGVNPKKIRVIALGVDDALFTLPDREDDGFTKMRPYIFYAGNHRPHKNLGTLCRAWASLPDEVNCDLVLTGEDDFAADVTRQRANGAKLFCVGNLSEAKLREVLQGATALVYPSQCEGFGLPMLEALAVGTAVIAGVDAVPRVIAHECIVVPTLDVNAWAAAIAAVHRGAPAERAARRTAVRQYSWERCARETAEVYRELTERYTINPDGRL
jgi:glycosyltransferase involved in cell wall biosynthesis